MVNWSRSFLLRMLPILKGKGKTDCREAVWSHNRPHAHETGSLVHPHLKDRNLPLSMSTAIATDQNSLASIKNNEWIAERPIDTSLFWTMKSERCLIQHGDKRSRIWLGVTHRRQMTVIRGNVESWTLRASSPISRWMSVCWKQLTMSITRLRAKRSIFCFLSVVQRLHTLASTDFLSNPYGSFDTDIRACVLSDAKAVLPLTIVLLSLKPYAKKALNLTKSTSHSGNVWFVWSGCQDTWVCI